MKTVSAAAAAVAVLLAACASPGWPPVPIRVVDEHHEAVALPLCAGRRDASTPRSDIYSVRTAPVILRT